MASCFGGKHDGDPSRTHFSKCEEGTMLVPGSRAAIVLLALVLILGACATPAGPSAGGPPAGAPRAATPPETAAAPSAPVKVRVARLNGSTNVPFRLAEERGYYQQEGLDVEFLDFASNSDMIPALATGQLEIVPMPSNPATWNAIARATPVRLVLDV